VRTTSEIIDEIEKHRGDFFGFIAEDLVGYLPFKKAKPYLADKSSEKEWKVLDQGKVVEVIKSYMSFAWDKANCCRGLSAGRSIEHMQAWLWLLGEDAAAKEIDNFRYYGKPQLAAICEHYGIDWDELDDGHWSNDEEGQSEPKVVARLTWDKAYKK